MAKEDGEDAVDDEDGQEEFKELEEKFKENVKKVKEMGVNWDDLKPKNHKQVDDWLKETAKSSKDSLDNPVEKHGPDEDDDDDDEEGGGKAKKGGKKDEPAKEEKGDGDEE